ncbi:unnamed protein product [Paramecium sonneborni]|uniref:Uncharacterized protein n=1 Tax=Paramecium sonneborni TaxID=65129 RepID=A0A8S1M282_9CILI|nr:unnamed protein product [Paramecium sonneborni]
MRLLVIIFMLSFISIAYAGANCVQAFCSKEVAECRSDETCQQHISKCSNEFRKKVGSAQKTGAYKGTEHALDDYNYCMRTHQKARAINDCQARHCLKKNLIGIDIEIENLQTIIA